MYLKLLKGLFLNEQGLILAIVSLIPRLPLSFSHFFSAREYYTCNICMRENRDKRRGGAWERG